MRRFILFLAILTLVGTGVYLYIHNGTVAPKTQTSNQNLFPISGSIIPSPDGTADGQIPAQANQSSGTSGGVVSPFKQITARAIAGYTVFNTPTTATVSATNQKASPSFERTIRYISRANGYVYEIKGASAPLQISNIYIPNIYEALFADNNKTAVLRFLRDDSRTIASYTVPIPENNPDGTRTQKEGVFLPENIVTVAVSPDGSLLAELTAESTGGVVTTATTVHSLRKEIIRSPLHEWLLSWPSKNTLYLQTKPSASVAGFLYRVDTTERRLRRVLGTVSGLTTSVSPSGAYVLYSESSGTSFTSKILNTRTNTTTNLNLSVLPEKCAWLVNEDLICAGNSTVAEGIYPDGWYAGITGFSDHLYRISTTNNTYRVLYDGSLDSFDMTNLRVNEDNRLIYFIDKPTGILWQFSY